MTFQFAGHPQTDETIEQIVNEAFALAQTPAQPEGEVPDQPLPDEVGV
jgi:hypothetical protein